MPYVQVHVDFDDLDLDDATLIAELESRGYHVIGKPADCFEGLRLVAEKHELENAHQRFHMGDQRPAAELLINLFRDATGKAI